jgi:ABC-type antimicrobial peptide transport system permease subunit
LKTGVYLYSIALSVILIYALTFICGLYPGWLATRIRPAEALHYE